ncbi:MAG: hypothetical protein PHE09_15605 [Oscillospiraceae bacterium]|nr:hypothetical protein [Oscillospiraceae bacterium]
MEDPIIFFQYVKAYNIKQKAERDKWKSETDISSWLNGHYISLAIDACLSDNRQYPQNPEMILSKADSQDSENEEESKASEQKQQEEAIKMRSAEIKNMLKNKQAQKHKS